MIIDYTPYFKEYPRVIAVHGKDKNCLILSKLNRPIKRLDGRYADYCLEHRWLSIPCQHEKDEAYACVTGSDTTYWQKKELIELGLNRLINGKITLFDMFILF